MVRIFKFTKVFERHPGIFYISKKCDTQTVVLREAYDRHRLIEKHPLTDIRERYASLMEKGFVDRSRGLYKKNKCEGLEEDPLERISGGELSGFQYEGESDDYRFSKFSSILTENFESGRDIKNVTEFGALTFQVKWFFLQAFNWELSNEGCQT
ncbi:unnamed protein product [Ilex paraguariensis]|uniref:PORR domain-containing protein n=1 Tax=Ilex paraguariensis TaxID=185542 RepID=A0ABC8UWH5_9AQUA